MRSRTGAEGREVQFSGVGFGIGNQFSRCVEGGVLIGHQYRCRAYELYDRSEVFKRIVGKSFVKMWVLCMGDNDGV